MLTAVQKTRVALVIMGFLMITGVLWMRLLWVQVIQPDHWVSLARRQHLEVLELLPTRGAILDRNLKPLAVSLQLTSVFGDPRHVQQTRQIAQILSPLIHRSTEEIHEKLSRKDRGFVWLARKVSNQAAAKIRALQLPGIHLKLEPQRVYPHGRLACHLVGFAGIDTQGLEGLELAADQLLKGEPGWRWLARDARRRPVGTWESPTVAARDGLELILTLDTTVQFIAERELDRVYRKTKAKGASIIVMDPFTGEILALANRPNFDPNHFSQVPPGHRRNRAVTDLFEPGSVFKVITAAIALGTGAVQPEDRFYCEEGAYRVAGRTLHDHRPHGWLSFREVVTRSSNIGIAKVAMRIGPESLYRGIRAFGFGTPTGILFPGEVAGIVKPPSEWSKPTITAIPMGHEIAVTPLQLAQAIAVVANGGWLIRPQIVKAVREPSGEIVQRSQPERVRRVLTAEVARQLREILVGVVEEGTGSRAKVPGVRTAGKTGTAQKIEPTGGYSHSRFIASFIGFAPAEHPKLVVVVLIDEPKPVYYGGVVAAPVFREVVAGILAYFQQEKFKVVRHAQVS